MNNMLKILHVVPDEQFIDDAIRIFNLVNVVNEYVSYDSNGQYVLIKKYASNVIYVKKEHLLEKISNGNFDIVAFHTIPRDLYEIVVSIPSIIKVLWFSWGFDVYQPQGRMPALIPVQLYKPITSRLMFSSRHISTFRSLKHKIKKILFFNQNRKYKKNEKIRLREEISLQNIFLRRIDYISTVLPTEYLILSEIPDFNASFFPFQYTSDEYFDYTSKYSNNANKILIGNSATPTNNHLDILYLLRTRNIHNNCILPCSYGDDEYAKLINEHTKKNNNVTIINEFMPRSEYVHLLQSCKVGIFGHMRQQAIGNILICMLQGSKVFLYRDSIAYKHFKSEGYVVFSIEDDLTIECINKELDEREISLNKKLITRQFGISNVVRRLEEVIDEISNIKRYS